MKRLYLISSGRLSRESNTISIETGNGKKYFPVAELGSILAFGEIDLNRSLLQFLSENRTPLHIFSYYGHYVGSFLPRTYNNSGAVLLNQAKAYINPEIRLKLAKGILSGAMYNMKSVISYYISKGIDLREELSIMENYANMAQGSRSIEELMGMEGSERSVYYRAFNKIIKREGFQFEGRERRPPRGRLNALISFGNGLLYAVILNEIYKTHLDPRIGFLHSTNNKKFSLNLDVSEVFKPFIVDRMIFYLINKQIIVSSDFLDKEGVFLSESGKKKFLEEFEKRLSATYYMDKLRKSVSVETLIRMELYKIEKFLLEGEEYLPFKMKW